VTDADLCCLARDAYAASPAGQAGRITWRDMTADVAGNVLAIRGTRSWLNLRRDMLIAGEISSTHPTLGRCATGALEAAEGLLALVPPQVDTLTGHSLGGQVAVCLAGLFVACGRPVRRLLTWDAPKAGGAVLADLLAGVEVRQYRFRGSVVSAWPLWLDQHVRAPLTPASEWIPDLIRAHSIDRAAAWMLAQGALAAA
jgi:hypothetical protein